MSLTLTLASMVAAILLSACRTSNLAPEPAPSEVLAVSAVADSARIYAGPDSADAGTIASVVAGGTGQGTVAGDGSFSFDAQLGAGASAVSQATVLTVQYVKAGFTLTSEATVIQQPSRVTKPLFSTGAGPNDMGFGNDSLYVANSMDNTVVRYGIDGVELDAIAFGEYASPSYLVLSNGALYVVCNGSNQLFAYSSSDFSGNPLHEGDLSLGGALAFPGPGVPAVIGDVVYIPMAMIGEFGVPDTIYDTGSLYYIELAVGGSSGMVDLSGENGQVSYYDASSGYIIITSAGQLQFDELWMPYVTTDSYMDILDPEDFDNPVASINLGQVAAGRFAISADGKTAYVGNALNGNLYKVDLETYALQRGTENPIVLTEEYTYISDVSVTPDGKYVLATSFNTDELYVIDSLTDTVNPGPYPAPFDLSLDPELMAGCANVEVDPTLRADGGYTAYVLYGVANAVARIELF